MSLPDSGQANQSLSCPQLDGAQPGGRAAPAVEEQPRPLAVSQVDPPQQVVQSSYKENSIIMTNYYKFKVRYSILVEDK